MNRLGHTSGPSNNPNQPNWRGDNRRGASTDDERQYSRKSFRSSSSTRQNPLPVGEASNQSAQNVLSRSQTSAAFPSPIHAHNTLPRPDGSRMMKSFSASSTSEQISTRGSQAKPNRFSPAVPTWNVLPPQPQRATVNQATRNFGHASAPSTIRGPGRKAGSGAPMWNPANEPRSLNVSKTTPSPRKKSPMQVVKSIDYPAPFWQHQDAEYEARQKIQRRLDKLGEIGHRVPLANPSSQKPRRAYLNPNFQVVYDPTSDDEDKEEGRKGTPMEVDDAPQKKYPQVPGRVARKQVSSNMMAARKTKWPRRRSRSGSDSPSASSSGGESGSTTPNSVVEVTDSESDEDEDGDQETADKPPLDSDIVVTELPQPLITIPLSQVGPAVFQDSPPSGPFEELTAALDEVCLGTVRMQQTKQLPFLLRNLRRGFRLRCKAINIKTTRSRPKMSILVRYEYTGKKYETFMAKWLCPLCELHGALPNKEMLRCHLHWDHPEVILERWEQRTNNQGKPEWRIHLLVPEIIYKVIQPRTYDIVPKIEPQEASVEPDPGVPTTPTPQPRSEVEERRSGATPTLFSLSPFRPSPSTTQGSFQDRIVTAPAVAVIPRVTKSAKFDPDELVTVKTLPPELRGDTPQTLRTSTTPSYVARSRSYHTDMQETEQLLSTVRIEHSPGPPGGIYPSPPPPHDPLGPAARIPILPAKSEYDGPDIEYSCRPGGATTFDLLGTLPMESFGVLEWDILEREEEIYESDDVQVEHKVMHALWLRWIILNRNEFIQNYYKGTIAFIDAYWRMIHQAAGWKAMRYWLLLLLTQRFLNGREVAKALKHYESLTGMTHW